MNTLAERTRSLWMADLPPAAPPLKRDLHADVAVIGAGLAGLTTAYLLAKAGKKVVVIDAGPPGGGMTCRTTAHLTNALDDRWYKVVKLRGEANAKLAAEAHTAAIDLVDSIQREENIACDFARVDGFLVLGPDHTKTLLERELKAAHKVGLTDISLDAACPQASLGAGPCLRFPRQARFHPTKYLRGLVDCITRDGGRMVTGRVTDVKGGSPAKVMVEGGHRIDSKTAVITTNTPLNDEALTQKQTPFRSYVLAGPVPKGAAADALIWDTEWPYHYVRIQPLDDAHDTLIIGGEDHQSGEADDMDARFKALEGWARERYPALERITWRWSGQVMESIDSLGFLGRVPGTTPNVYTVSGDSGLGMTHCTIGAMIITAAVLKQPNRWTQLFDPARRAASAKPPHQSNTHHAKPHAVTSVADIPLGGGAVITRGKEKVAVYRTKDDRLIERSAACTHQGCTVAWNPLEECWDCPCHGSQFAADATVVHGPATANLQPAPAALNGTARKVRARAS